MAVRTERWKQIRLRRGGSELYDLEADPGGQRNVIERHPAEARVLARVADGLAAARERRRTEETVVDPGTVDELRALGYVE